MPRQVINSRDIVLNIAVLDYICLQCHFQKLPLNSRYPKNPFSRCLRDVDQHLVDTKGSFRTGKHGFLLGSYQLFSLEQIINSLQQRTFQELKVGVYNLQTPRVLSNGVSKGSKDTEKDGLKQKISRFIPSLCFHVDHSLDSGDCSDVINFALFLP